MAMLAEPRRKQKWSVDPRNSTWSKDESKFGQKMLEKMGWSKGKGLGAQEQGSTEHIKVQVKNNTLGLGAANNHEDNWIAHQDDFNQLLAELNSCHGTGSAASSDGENKKSFSLEEKSKSSKKRVHYMKFAKGKDLSCRSDTDLACIFGKREKVKKSPQDKTDSEPEENEDQSPSPTTEAEPANTVTSSLSVSEYFAKRMAELKKSRANGTESTEHVEPCPEDTVESFSEDTKKKSKKKKRRKNNDYCPEEPKVEENIQEENHMDTTERRRKTKSERKNKVLTVEIPEVHEEEDHQDETLRKKKKKKKNKRKKELCDERQAEDVTSTPDEDLDIEKPKKKKKKRKQERTE